MSLSSSSYRILIQMLGEVSGHISLRIPKVSW
jgi:hypothetical protein